MRKKSARKRVAPGVSLPRKERTAPFRFSLENVLSAYGVAHRSEPSSLDSGRAKMIIITVVGVLACLARIFVF